MMTLFRIVEVSSGTITIDGIDISKIGLSDLRARLSIIPQDAVLFNGTLRSNLDPFEEHDDATLHDALKRSYLIEQDTLLPAIEAGETEKVDSGSSTPAKQRFTLDLQIEDEGSNLSVGERSLVSLARALVKNSKIIILESVLHFSFLCPRPGSDLFLLSPSIVRLLLPSTLLLILAFKPRSDPNSTTRP